MHVSFQISVFIFLRYIPGSDFAGSYSSLFLVFWGTCLLFSTVTSPNYTPISSVKAFPFLHSHQHLVFAVSLMTVSLRVTGWYFIMPLIFISLMVSDVEHLFICLLAICMPSLEKCLFRSSVHFFNHDILLLHVEFMICLYISYINHLFVIFFANFSTICWFVFLFC